MNPETQSDHDLLVELRVEQRGISRDIAEIKDNTKTQMADHETRLRALEQWRWIIVGGFTLALAALTLYVTYFPRTPHT